MWVGKSEENLRYVVVGARPWRRRTSQEEAIHPVIHTTCTHARRKVFAEAEEEYKEKGPDRAGLHVIIFDEVDALMRKRGSRHDSSGVLDSCVNQLLSKIDGLAANDNMCVGARTRCVCVWIRVSFLSFPSFNPTPSSLVIGTTNRKDLLDEAILRPGRLEVHVDVGLPDEKGRERIFGVHTAGFRREGCLAPDVDLGALARATQNFTGAEIEGVVKVRGRANTHTNLASLSFAFPPYTPPTRAASPSRCSASSRPRRPPRPSRSPWPTCGAPSARPAPTSAAASRPSGCARAPAWPSAPSGRRCPRCSMTSWRALTRRGRRHRRALTPPRPLLPSRRSSRCSCRARPAPARSGLDARHAQRFRSVLH